MIAVAVSDAANKKSDLKGDIVFGFFTIYVCIYIGTYKESEIRRFKASF